MRLIRQGLDCSIADQLLQSTKVLKYIYVNAQMIIMEILLKTLVDENL